MAQSTTSIESLPVKCLLQILSHLPFKDRVRIGGVNRFFNDVSTSAIDQMKSLDLTNDIMQYSLWNRPFAALLQSCSPNLERINASFRCDKNLLALLPKFSYPKLDHLEIAIADSWNKEDIRITKKCAFDLIDRNRSIRSITLWLAHEFEFPKNIIFEKLERLEIYGCHKRDAASDLPTGLAEEWNYRPQVSFDGLLRSLSGQVPNLKHFLIMTYSERVGGIPATVECSILNDFLASVRDFKSLHLCLDWVTTNDLINDLPNTWRHGSLIELRVEIYNGDSVNISIIDKISSSFPNLQTFISRNIHYDGVMALNQLKNLRNVHIRELIPSWPVFMELMALPMLEYLEIYRIDGIDSAKLLVSLLTSIPDSRKKITIQFNCYYFESVWVTEFVKMVLEQMKTNGGPAIRIIGCQ